MGAHREGSMSMGITLEWWQLAFSLLTAALSSAVLVAIINQVFTRRRMKAEADKLKAEADKLAAEAKKLGVDSADVIAGNWQELWCQMLVRVRGLEERLDVERNRSDVLETQLNAVREQLGARIVKDAEREAELVMLRSQGASKDRQISALSARVQELEQTVLTMEQRLQTLCDENNRLKNGGGRDDRAVAGDDPIEPSRGADAAGGRGADRGGRADAADLGG
jgi:cell division protein FtsB